MGNITNKVKRNIKSKSDMSATALSEDPDVVSERIRFDAALRLSDPASVSIKPEKAGGTASAQSTATAKSNTFVPLHVSGNTYQTSADTAQLLKDIGGSAAIHKMTGIFYKKCFDDPHVDQFIISHSDPHFVRLGNWIVEKMGGEGNVWTEERVERSKCPVMRTLSNGSSHTVHDRTSAHVAAWWSPKRRERDAGEHFCVHDCRVWMRLMFWSAREAGLLANPAFADWYVRFIGHFVRVYERQAPMFARESARWSADPANVAAYLAAGRTMPDVTGADGAGVPVAAAAAALPPAERNDEVWPYGRG